MKRLVLALSLGWCLILWPPAAGAGTHASGLHPIAQPQPALAGVLDGAVSQVAGSLRPARTAHSAESRAPTRGAPTQSAPLTGAWTPARYDRYLTLTGEREGHAQVYRPLVHMADIDLGAFAAPLSILTSSGAEVLSQGVEDNASAASDDLFLRFGTKTAASLAAEGRQTGFGAQAVLHVGQGILYAYFASVYGTSDQATAAFARQKNGWAATSGSKELAVLPVGDAGQSDNWAAAGKVQGKDVSVEEVFFRRGRILVEDLLYLYAGDVDQYGTDAVQRQQELARSLDDIAVAQQAGETGPTGTPTPIVTSFRVNSVTIHRKGDERSPAIHKVKAGKRIFILVDWTLKGSPPDAKPTYTFIARRSGRVTAKDAFQGELAAYPPDEYVVYSAVKLAAPGTYTIAGRVTVSGKTHKATTSLTVTR